jgi:hypothetical protein
MGSVHEELSDQVVAWIERQPLFFVGSAPLDPEGHVNVSPKGTAGTLTVIDRRTVAYLDLTGSGIETVAHVQENSRITLMWCAFEGPPRIVRMHGRGQVVLPGTAGWPELRRRFAGSWRGARAIVVVHGVRFSDSCGYSVPVMRFEADRTRLDEWTAKRNDDELTLYRASHNRTSIDGLAALP